MITAVQLGDEQPLVALLEMGALNMLAFDYGRTAVLPTGLKPLLHKA